MSTELTKTTWIEDARDIITLVNRSTKNYTLELPSGRYRLDAGRRMRTTRAILKVQPVKTLIDEGQIAVE